MTTLECNGLLVEVPDDWEDVTEDDLPFTLARPEGVGALQFTIGRYQKGKAPRFTPQALRTLLQEWAAGRRFGAPLEEQLHEGPVRWFHASYRALLGGEDAFVRAWDVSDGMNIARITYITSWESRLVDREAIDGIIAGLSFVPIAAAAA